MTTQTWNWTHMCLSCRRTWDTTELESECPACGPGRDYETWSDDAELSRYGTHYLGDWRRILALHDLTTYAEDELREPYDDLLDECNPEVRIGTLAYTPSHVLKEVDPIAYDQGFAEYLDQDFTEHPYLGGKYLRRDEYEDAIPGAAA